MPPTPPDERREIHRGGIPWVLLAWVVGCVVVAGVAAALVLGGDSDDVAEIAAPDAPAATADDSQDRDEGATSSTAPEAEAETVPADSTTTTAPPADRPDVPPWLEGDLDGDGAVADDLDADGDGVLDDWVAPDATIDQYKPGDQAVDGEFEEDRRAAQGCLPNYPEVCVPPAPPILTCEQAGAWNALVEGGDPHGLDADMDGIACEFEGEGEGPLPPELDPPDPDG